MGNASSSKDDSNNRRNKANAKRRYVVSRQQHPQYAKSTPDYSHGSDFHEISSPPRVSVLVEEENEGDDYYRNTKEQSSKNRAVICDTTTNQQKRSPLTMASEAVVDTTVSSAAKTITTATYGSGATTGKVLSTATQQNNDVSTSQMNNKLQPPITSPSIDIIPNNSNSVTAQCGSSSTSSGSAKQSNDPYQRRPVLSAYSQSLTDNPSQHFTEHLQQTDRTMMSNNDDNPMLQTVFKWDRGGKEVYVTGTFTDWKPIKMVQSQGDFFTVVDVPEGHHEYKFIVDGQDKTDPNSDLNDRHQANVLEVKKSDFEVFEALQNDIATEEKNKERKREPIGDLSGSPPGVYSQEIPSGLETPTRNGKQTNPPVLPPYLLEVILNNPKSFHDKILLPQPNHVMLNHLYALSIQDGVMVMSDIHRYRNKYVTTLFYKPI